MIIVVSLMMKIDVGINGVSDTKDNERIKELKMKERRSKKMKELRKI